SSSVLLTSPQVPWPGLSLAGVRLVLHHLGDLSRVAAVFLSHACHRHYPGGISWVLVSVASPEAAAFPEIQAGRLPHYPFRGLLNVHSRYGLDTRRVTYSDPLHRRLQSLIPCATAPIATG